MMDDDVYNFLIHCISRDTLVEKHRKEKTDLVGIMSRMSKQYGDADTDLKHEFATLREDIRNKASHPTSRGLLVVTIIP